MKKVYIQPDMESEKFELEDVITASGAKPPVSQTTEINLSNVEWKSDVTFDDKVFD